MKTFNEFLFEDVVTRSGGYLAYVLAGASRTALLNRFEPKYPKVVCEHVTYKFPAKTGDAMPPIVHDAHVIGYQDGDGIEALVVEINGSTKRPSDGKLFHITLSFDPSEKKPVHSNDLLAEKGFSHVTPIAIHLEPKQVF